jgi:transcription elongation factor GreA
MGAMIYYSKEGYEKLQKELHYYKTVQRPEISRQIAEARDKGDLSENAEYDAAKDAQSMLELKISKLEAMLANARIIDKKDIDNSQVRILSTVRIKNYRLNKEFEYTLVSELEANHKEGKLSVNSPIGKALIGKKPGDIVETEVPAGILKLEILEIK